MSIDKKLIKTQLTIVICSSLKGEERVDIDSPKAYALLGIVIGVHIVSSRLGGVHWVASIARSRLR